MRPWGVPYEPERAPGLGAHLQAANVSNRALVGQVTPDGAHVSTLSFPWRARRGWHLPQQGQPWRLRQPLSTDQRRGSESFWGPRFQGARDETRVAGAAALARGGHRSTQAQGWRVPRQRGRRRAGRGRGERRPWWPAEREVPAGLALASLPRAIMASCRRV